MYIYREAKIIILSNKILLNFEHSYYITLKNGFKQITKCAPVNVFGISCLHCWGMVYKLNSTQLTVHINFPPCTKKSILFLMALSWNLIWCCLTSANGLEMNSTNISLFRTEWTPSKIFIQLCCRYNWSKSQYMTLSHFYHHNHEMLLDPHTSLCHFLSVIQGRVASAVAVLCCSPNF